MPRRSVKKSLLPLPKSPTDPIKLADWLELSALLAPDGNASRGDLESMLRTASLFEGDKVEALDRTLGDVFLELEDRAKAAGRAYPFEIAHSLLSVRLDWREFPAYVFCLCLSYFGCSPTSRAKSLPRRWFEHLSRDAVQQYLGGEALRFGSPRLKEEIPVGFKQAIAFLCKKITEGVGFKDGGLPNRRDDALDIVAWKHFPDTMGGKLMLFGNCASEQDWESSHKTTELTPGPFCDDWMIDRPVSPLVSSLFIPHRPQRKHFNSHLRRAGIIFDRCRISYWAHGIGPTSRQIKQKRFFNYAPLAKWAKEMLEAGRS